jgi:hypothetical protein
MGRHYGGNHVRACACLKGADSRFGPNYRLIPNTRCQAGPICLKARPVRDLAFGRRHGTERSRGVSLPETRCRWPMAQNLSSAAPNSVTSSHNDSSLSPKAGRGPPPPIPGSASAIIANISAIALALRSRRAEFVIAVPGSIRFSGSANGSAASRMLGATFRQNFGAISPMDRLL